MIICSLLDCSKKTEKKNTKMKRDNFTQCDEETLKDRVGGRCSNPLCMRDTVGPKANMGSSVSVGEAAHIYAASEGGPRFNKCSKNSPTSSGGEMNCTSEHICSKKSL